MENKKVVVKRLVFILPLALILGPMLLLEKPLVTAT
jgi:hypothetical protein